MSDDYRYEMPDGVPLDPIESGTTVLVAGGAHAGTRDLSLRMALADREEASLLVSTNTDAQRLIADCETAAGREMGRALAVVDCVGEGNPDRPEDERVSYVSNPGDLTGIGIEFSSAYEQLYHLGTDHVRTWLYSVSTLLMYADFQPVSRFLHTLGGRVSTTDGLGVFVVDPDTQDDRVVSTISQLFDGRIDVRETDDGPEVRARGLRDQPDEWLPCDLEAVDAPVDTDTD